MFAADIQTTLEPLSAQMLLNLQFNRLLIWGKTHSMSSIIERHARNLIYAGKNWPDDAVILTLLILYLTLLR
jgi:hypothetical protein